MNADTIRENLERMMGPILPSDLVAHVNRDAAFIVAPVRSLIDVGVAIALDDVEVVKGLIESGDLRKPSRSERDAWPPGVWVSIVVQPFVLVQLSAADTTVM